MKNNENELPKFGAICRSEVAKDGKSRISYTVRFGGKTILKSSGLSVKKKNWNPKKGEVVGSTRELNRIKAKLNEKQSEFENYFLKFDAAGWKITRKAIDDFFEDRSYDDFLSYYNAIVEKRKKIEPLSKSTFDKYELFPTVLLDFCKLNKVDRLRFNDINLKFVTDFDKYLIYNRKFCSGTANNYTKCFKYVLKQAILDEIIIRSPYLGFTAIKTDAVNEIIPLTDKEIKAIEKAIIPTDKKHLERIRDFYVFMLNTGIRYNELAPLNINDIIEELSTSNSESLNSFIKVYQNKVKKVNIIPLNEKAKNLIKKYRDAYNLKDGLIFPYISNQDFNRELKVLAKIALIDKNLKCHLSRHSFATKLIRRNVSLENVSALLGHSDIKMTRRYAKIDNNNLAIAVNLL